MNPGSLLVGRYEVVRGLGTGAAGELLLVRDRKHEQEPCALKILRPRVKDPGLEPLFRAEFLLLAEIHHPSIVAVREFGVIEGEPYFTMDFVPGENCRSFVREDRLAANEYLDLAVGLLDALAHVHACGVLHRDVKPENIVMRRGDGRLEPVLVDFGLAVTAGAQRTGEAAGTLPYVAPEILSGATADARADLFSLGMVLFEVATGKKIGDRVDLLRAPGTALAPDRVRRLMRRSARGGVPRRYEDLVSKLLAPVPATRYPTAAAALRDMAEFFGPEVAEGTAAEVAARPQLGEAPLVGRATALAALMQRAEALIETTLLEPLAVVAGPAGMGVTRLLATLRNHAAVSGCLVASGRSLGELAADLLSHPQVADGAARPGSTPQDQVFRMDAALHALSGDDHPVLLLDDTHKMGDDEAAALREWVAALERRPGRARVLFVIGGRSEGEGPGVEILKTAGRAVPHELRDLAPLKRNDIRVALATLLGQPRIPTEVVQLLMRATGGNPRLFGEVLHLLVQEGVLELGGEKPEIDADKLKEVRLPRGVAEATRQRVERLPKPAARIVKRLALIEDPLPAHAARALAGEHYDLLIDERLLILDRGRVRFASELTRRGADLLKGKARDKARIETANALEEHAPSVAAALYAEADDLAKARACGLPAAQILREHGQLEEARQLLERLLGADPDPETGELLRQVLRATGRAGAAADLGLRMLNNNNDPQLALATAAALRVSGRAEKALAVLQSIDRNPSGEMAMRITNAKAAVLDSLDRFDEALLESRRAEAAAGSLLGFHGRIARVRANILRRMGRTRAAAAVEDAILNDRDHEVGGKERQAAYMNRALLNARRGNRRAALVDLRAAYAAARELKALSAELVALWGLGDAFLEFGRADRAARMFDRVRELAEITGAQEDMAAALVRQAQALSRCGRPAEAEIRLARAQQLPGYDRFLGAQTDAASCRAVLVRLAGDNAKAVELSDQVLAMLDGPGAFRARSEAARATALRAQGDASETEAAWRRAIQSMWRERLADTASEIRVGLAECAGARGAWNLAERFVTGRQCDEMIWSTPLRARALIVRGGAALHHKEPAAAGRFIEEAVAVANRCDDAPLRAEVYAAAASLIEEGDMQRHLRQPTAAGSAALLEVARDIWGLYGNESMLRKIDLHLSELPQPAAGPMDGPTSERLVKVLHVTREMNREFNRDRLLNIILDRAIELTGAERGFVILLDEGQETVHLARNLDRESVSEPERKISSQIIKEVVRTGRIVRSEDAEIDNRFEEYLSVRQLRLKSIIAVPFRSGGRTVGALYLDNRFRVGNFGEGEERLLELFADQAVAAIDKSELVRELEGKRTEVEDLYKRLKAELKKTGSELRYARKELKQHRRARGWGFDRIVARSVAMQAVVREAKRLSPTELYVLLTGENGTGKEVVARAMHYASHRQNMAFVAVNCAAFPEGLLEAELFGHVRGSFTGADRDRPGLFEEADGGTLFLDEIGDMALSMQVKLLRALEFGEIRRVGESKVRTVDVRIISATNADVEQHIRNGKFREDLYYRLAGYPLRLPPLRERLEDVEPLAYAFVEEAARREGRPELTISNEAIARLESFSWSGNVRELRNVVLRAAVTAEAETIRPEDVRLDSRGPSLLPGFDPGQADRILDELANSGFDLNGRQQTAVNRVLTRGKLSFGEYRELFRVSKSTTARDLEILVGHGLLEKRGKTRAVLYLPGATLQEAARKASEQ